VRGALCLGGRHRTSAQLRTASRQTKSGITLKTKAGSPSAHGCFFADVGVYLVAAQFYFILLNV
jgi:hypothetical protein